MIGCFLELEGEPTIEEGEWVEFVVVNEAGACPNVGWCRRCWLSTFEGISGP
jgi:hypothetical protein